MSSAVNADPGSSPSGVPPEDLGRLLEAMDSSLYYRPMPAVLDTDCVRTGLHFQLSRGMPPASVSAARSGLIRLFMERETLIETIERLPKFARQFRVPVADLERMLSEDWLPYIRVVALPPGLRRIDPRAGAVRDADSNDYAAAALAALLSPCILLTRNHHHFAALGVSSAEQGVNGVLAVIAVQDGQMHVRITLSLPAVPVRLAVAGGKWAARKIGPVPAALILLTAAATGIWWYRGQPAERREQVKDAVLSLGRLYMEQYNAAGAELLQARVDLRGSLVPRPERRSAASAVLRELALATQSLSAQQIAGLLDPPIRPAVPQIRAFLRGNGEIFDQVRRGGYELGTRYTL
jgi:hypothetical protein